MDFNTKFIIAVVAVVVVFGAFIAWIVFNYKKTQKYKAAIGGECQKCAADASSLFEKWIAGDSDAAGDFQEKFDMFTMSLRFSPYNDPKFVKTADEVNHILQSMLILEEDTADLGMGLKRLAENAGSAQGYADLDRFVNALREKM